MANNTSVVTNFAGQENVNPRLVRVMSTATLGQVLTPGFLSNNPAIGGNSIVPTDIICATYLDSSGDAVQGFFTPSFSNGVITLTQTEVGGDVTGPVTSFDNAIALFSGVSGKEIKTIDFTPAANTLFGFNNTSVPSGVTVTSPLTLSGNVLGVSGGGLGDVVGPASATANGVAFFDGTTGKLLQNTPFDPSNSSLLGYDETGLPVNVTAGTNVTISGNVISVESGAGNVTGSGTSVAGLFPVYTDTTGLAINPAADVALTASSILGVDDGGANLINVTAGAGITISGGTIAATASGGGNVVGSGTSVTHTLPMYTDTTGLAIEPSPVALTANTILGTNAGGTALTNITAGTGISISSGVITATTAGGTVTGPVSSTIGAIAAYTTIDGTEIGDVAYTPVPKSLVGYGPTGGTKVVNIKAGTNITITDDGFINAAGGGGGGSGDVTGPASSFDGNFALFSGTTGKFIENTAYTPTANRLIGYDVNAKVAEMTVGAGLALSGNNLSVNGEYPVVIKSTGVSNYTVISSDLGKALWATPTVASTYLLPKATSVSAGFQCWVVCNSASASGSITFEPANIVTDNVYSNLGTTPSFGSLENNVPRWAKVTLIDQATGTWYVEIDSSILIRSRTITEAGFTPNGLDNNGIVVLNNSAAPYAVSLPPSTNSGYAIGYTFTLYQLGTQTTPINAAGSDTITGINGLNVASINTEGVGTSIKFTLTGTRGAAVWIAQYSSLIYPQPKVITDADYTMTINDGDSVIYMLSASPHALKLPPAVLSSYPSLPKGWSAKIIQAGAGVVTISANSLTSDGMIFYPGGIQTPITTAGAGSVYDVFLVGNTGSINIFSISGPS